MKLETQDMKMYDLKTENKIKINDTALHLWFSCIFNEI